MSCCRSLLFACLFTAAGASPVVADVEADRAAITDRLHRWAAAFNSRDAKGVCDLFAENVISTVPSTLDGGRDVVCGRLDAILAKPGVQLDYKQDIREITVAGDIAVVRLFWTLTSQRGDHREVSPVAGMDIFERQSGGTWAIVRSAAFTADSASPP